MMQQVGIDVSKANIDLSWLRDIESGKKKTKKFESNEKLAESVDLWLQKNLKCDPADILITLEPTGVYHERLCYELHAKGYILNVVNPGKASSFADSINLVHKTDKSDATMLAYYGHSLGSRYRRWEPEAAELRELKSLMRRLETLEKDLQREENRLEALSYTCASDEVTQSVNEVIDMLKAQIKKLTKDVDDHIDKYPQMKKNRELLETIPAVGPVVSRIMTYLFSAKKFENARQVSAYLGLIPRMRESGKMKGKVTMSKRGNALIRAKLYLPAVVAMSKNPEIKAMKERMLATRKVKMQVIGAAMKRLVHICFGVIKHQEEYRPQTT